MLRRLTPIGPLSRVVIRPEEGEIICPVTGQKSRGSAAHTDLLALLNNVGVGQGRAIFRDEKGGS